MIERRRDIATAPATLLPNIASQRLTLQADRYDEIRTAPHLGHQDMSKFFIPALSPATHKQNLRLAALLKILNKAGSSDDHSSGLFAEGEIQLNDNATLQLNFDKNWLELMKMIEFAKNLNENDNGKDFLPDLVDYSVSKKHFSEIKKITTANSTAVDPTISKNVPQLAGRKPIRAIIQDLQKKIQILKNNPVQWDLLEQKVLSYTAKTRIRSAGNHILSNKRSAFSPDQRYKRINDSMSKHRMRQQSVKATKEQRDKKDLDRKLEQIERKEARLARTLASEKDFSGSPQAIQSRWFIVIFLAVRVSMIKQTLQSHHMAQDWVLTKTHSAKVIQRWYRTFLNKKYQQRVAEALKVISRAFTKYYAKWKYQRLQKASTIIHCFFKEVYDVSKLMKVVKKYRLSVVKGQRYVRAKLKCREAQVHAITKYWDSLENSWWLQHSKGNRSSQNDLNEDKKSKNKKKKKKDDGDKGLRVSEPIKNRYILENLIQRRKEFIRTANAPDNQSQLLVINKQNSKKAVFKLLPTLPQLHEMMEKAYLESRFK